MRVRLGEVVLPGTNLIDREREIALLDEALLVGTQIVFLEGERAVGKTALVHDYIETHRPAFPGGVVYTYGLGMTSVIDIVRGGIDFPPTEAALLVIDEAHELPPEALSETIELHDSSTELRVLLVGEPSTDPFTWERGRELLTRVSRITIGGLPRTAVRALVDAQGWDVPEEFAMRIYDAVGDRPYFLEQALRAAQEGTITPSNLEALVASFFVRGILGPDGLPYTGEIEVPDSVIVTVRSVNDELLARLRSKPQLLRHLSPRQFEEVVAELLVRQGYEVDLSPATRDGGFDMYAARSDQLGSFLFLVECKRYTPPRKVGVEVVRSLYGAVQQRKATAGIIATTSFFSADATDFQRDIRHQISLRDYIEIKEWLRLV
jgi:restriction system protein